METQTCQSHSDLNFRKGKIANLFTQIIFINLIGWFPSPQMRGKKRCGKGRARGGGAMPGQGRAAGCRKRPIWPPAPTTWTVRALLHCGEGICGRWSHVRVRSSVGQEILSHFAGQHQPSCPHTTPTNAPFSLFYHFFKYHLKLIISCHATGHIYKDTVSFEFNTIKISESFSEKFRYTVSNHFGFESIPPFGNTLTIDPILEKILERSVRK